MFRRTRDLNAPRRVVALHLLFGVVTVALLTVGIVQVTLSVLSTREDTAVVSMINQAASLIRFDYRYHNGDRLQEIVEHLAHHYSLEACAVVSPDQVYLAHSNPTRSGTRVQVPEGVSTVVMDINRLDHQESSGRWLSLYTAPLRDGDQTFATIHITRSQPGSWQIIRSATDHGIWFILLGLGSCLAGSVLLWKSLRPLAEVERQLREAAASEGKPLAPERVVPSSLAAIGWNRFIEEKWGRSQSPELSTKVMAGLAAHRDRRSEAVLKSLPDGIAMTDQDQRITFANTAMGALLNRSDTDLSGKSMDEFLRFSVSPNGAKRLMDPQYDSQPVVVELGRDGDMSRGVLRVARVPLVNSKPEASSGHVWILRDVTQQKLAEQMRNQFVYSATHELRTPLANIKAYAETLGNMTELDLERQKEFCNTINYEASRLSRFIDDLLDISRMETGALGVQRHETDLMRLLEESLAKVRPEMEAKRITLDVNIPAKLPKVNVDKDKLTVTLVNLLGNAGKYTPEGGRVALEVEWLTGQILIHVVDSGIGISQEEIPKIFDKFFRSNDPRVQDRTGSGLGLAIAQEIARLHGGKISVHSELDKGSKFTLSLPLK